MIIAQENTENGEVILREGPAGYEIIVDGQFLMSSASGNSSVALVELGLAKLTPRKNLSVLIGGLGLGFSLRAALTSGSVTAVTVIELEAQIIEWHRQGLISETVRLLNDPRTRLIHEDFLQFMDGCAHQYDFIALDIDNGPEWLCHEANSQLYRQDHLAGLQKMLRPQGIITFWSAASSRQFKQSLERVFGKVEEVAVADHNGEGKPITAFVYICQLE